MIQPGLQVTERLNQLLAWRELEKTPCFIHSIEPLYRAAEFVVQEHASLYLDFIEQLYIHSEASTVMAWLKSQQAVLRPLRRQLQDLEMMHPDAELDALTGPDEEKGVNLFAQHMVDLMRACLALVEDGHLPFGAYGYEVPSVLTQLSLGFQAPFLIHRSLYVDLAKRQYQAVQAIWENVVEQYAELKVAHRESQPQTRCEAELECPTSIAVELLS